MPKDKLMQAAGRLRQLGRGQRVVLMGLPDISSKIAAAAAAMTAATGPVAAVSSSAAAAAGESTIGGRNKRSGLKLDWFSPKKQKGGSREPDMRAVLMGLPDTSSKIAAAAAATAAATDFVKQQKGTGREPDMRAVLTWVLFNTVQATLSGISEAASQGMQFAATYGGPPAASVLPERLSLGDLYGSSKGEEAVPLVLAGVAKQYSAHAIRHFTPDASGIGPSADGQLEAAVATTAGADSALAAGSSGCSALDRMVAKEQQLQLSGSLSSMSQDDNTGDRSMSTFSSISGSAANLPGISLNDAHDSFSAATNTVVSDLLDDVRSVCGRFSALGAGHCVVSGGSGADEECERELEQEEEEEQEVERQLPAATAAAVTDWDWASAFTATSPAQLRGCTVLQLSQVLQLVASTGGVGGIGWCDRVWATHNFVHSIAASGAPPGLSDYLRPVGALLMFAGSGQLLLLSEREADALQRELWGHTVRRTAKPANLLLSLPYLRLACNTDIRRSEAAGSSSAQQQQVFMASELSAAGSSTAAPAASHLQRVLSVDALVSVQLFGGYMMYGSGAQRVLLHDMVSGRREAAQELVGWRGKLHTLPRSDLDRACADDTCC
jgi:hypothetical protein